MFDGEAVSPGHPCLGHGEDRRLQGPCATSKRFIRKNGLRLCVSVALLCLSLPHAACNSLSYYRLLGVDQTASTATIKRAYKELAKKYHPDKFKGQPPVKMEELNRAHEVLTDPDLRKKYDMYGKDPDDREVQQQEAMKERQRYRPMEAFYMHSQRRNQLTIESKTQTLTMDNYDELVNSLGHVWIIQVWLDHNCNGCVEISQAWEEAAKELKGSVQFGRINYERQGALLSRLRIRHLPTVFGVNGGEVRMMPNRPGILPSTQDLIAFATEMLLLTGKVMKVESRSAFSAWLKQDVHKVHALLIGKDWAPFYSVAGAESLKDWVIFAHVPLHSVHILPTQYQVQSEGSVVLAIKEDGSFRKKEKLSSRSVLVRFLLQHKYNLVPLVNNDNFAELCMGLMSSMSGLRKIYKPKEQHFACVLSLSNTSEGNRRPELEALRKVASDFKAEKEGLNVQFGWSVLVNSDRLWKFLEASVSFPPAPHGVIAVIDWHRGWLRVFDKGGKDAVVEQELREWVKTVTKQIQEDRQDIPAIPARRSPFSKLMDVGDVVGSNMTGTNWSIWMGLLFAALSILNYFLTSPSEGERRQGRQSSRRPTNSRSSAQNEAPGSGSSSNSSSRHSSTSSQQAGSSSAQHGQRAQAERGQESGYHGPRAEQQGEQDRAKKEARGQRLKPERF